MKIKINEIGILNGRKDYQCFCPICNMESRGYVKEFLFRSIVAHLEVSHKIIWDDKTSSIKECKK